MFEDNIKNKTLIPLKPATIPELDLSERYDLQEWIAHSPEIVGEEIQFISKKLSVSSASRLDLLVVYREGNGAATELKRDSSGRSMDW